jgi:penicillin-binding protein 1A
MMSSVVNDPKGTGTAAKFKNSAMPVVGKTGTTTNTKDLTFVGYTPYYVGSIWMGYDRYDTTVPNMDGLSNQHAHVEVWRNVMERIHQNLEVKDFPQPEGIKEVTICADTGYLPNGGCTTMTEYFADGTQPTKYCTGHGSSGSSGDSGSSSGSSSSSDSDEGSSRHSTSSSRSEETAESEASTPEEQTPATGGGGDTSEASTPQSETPAAETPQEEAPAAETPSADTGGGSDDVIVEPLVS